MEPKKAKTAKTPVAKKYWFGTVFISGVGRVTG
jgi:hypothetical protein